MLRLLLNGAQLDLPPEFKISLIYENPLLTQDKIPITKSLTFELPSTQNNLELLGRPDRMTSKNSFKELDGLEIFFGPERLMYGTLIVKKYKRAISVFFRNSGLLDLIKLPINELTLERYDFGEGNEIFPGILTPDEWGYNYTELILNSTGGTDKFVAPPVRISEETWPGENEDAIAPPTNNGRLAMMTMYANMYHTPSEELNDGQYTLGEINPHHATVYPSPFVSHVIEQIFGDLLVYNPFQEDIDLSKMILMNFYHPNYVREKLLQRKGILSSREEVDFITDQFYFSLEDFLSETKGNDLIKDLLKMISHSLFMVGNSVKIVSSEQVINSITQLDWSSKLVGKPQNSEEPPKEYRIAYDGISDENNDPDKYESVDTIEELDDEIMSVVGEKITKHIADQNQIISRELKYKDESNVKDMFEHKLVAHGFGGYGPTSGDVHAIGVGLNPLFNNLDVYWTESSNISGIHLRTWYVPIYNGGRSVLEKPSIMIYHGIVETLDLKPVTNGVAYYPFSSAHNYDAKGNRHGDLSLQWTGKSGLHAKFHKPFAYWLSKTKKRLEANFLLTSSELKNLDLSKKVFVESKNFIIEKVQVEIELNKINPALINLIEAVDYESTFQIDTALDTLKSLLIEEEPIIPSGFCFNKNRDKLYVVGYDNSKILQYNLAIPGNFDSAIYSGNYMDFDSIDPIPIAICINSDDSKLFVYGYEDDRVYQIDLPEDGNIAEASYSNVYLEVLSTSFNIGIDLSPRGDKLYVANNPNILEFDLAEKDDLNSASLNASFDVSSEAPVVSSVKFNYSGNKFYITTSSNKIHQYSLPFSWDDIDNASYDDIELDLGLDFQPIDLNLSKSGRNLEVLSSTNNRIHQFRLD
ncbi:MAG: hypothetical protein JXR07_19990 [Reichenbachiella sp.]